VGHGGAGGGGDPSTHRPEDTRRLQVAVVGGTGILTTTLFPVSSLLKLAMILMLSTTRVLPCSSTTGMTLKGRLTFSAMR
jgi:hypothetical protein